MSLGKMSVGKVSFVGRKSWSWIEPAGTCAHQEVQDVERQIRRAADHEQTGQSYLGR